MARSPTFSWSPNYYCPLTFPHGTLITACPLLQLNNAFSKAKYPFIACQDFYFFLFIIIFFVPRCHLWSGNRRSQGGWNAGNWSWFPYHALSIYQSLLMFLQEKTFLSMKLPRWRNRVNIYVDPKKQSGLVASVKLNRLGTRTTWRRRLGHKYNVLYVKGLTREEENRPSAPSISAPFSKTKNFH